MQLVGARLGDDVDEAAAGAPEFRVGPLRHHHHFLHCVQIKGEGRALAAALLAEEGIVKISAIHRDVVVNAALPADAQFVAVGALDNGHTWGQQRQAEEIAPVVGQVLHRLFGQARGWLALGYIHRGQGRLDDHFLHLRQHFDDQFHGLTDSHLHPGLPHFGLSGRLYRHVVEAEGQQGRGEQPQIGRGKGALVIGAGFLERDGGIADGVAKLVPDNAADYAGGRLGLCPSSVEQDDPE